MTPVALATCSRRGCTYPVANDGAWAAGEVQDCCARHRQLQRLREGRCPNCGGAMADQPIINSLTGKPRTQAGVPLTARTCTNGSCGYVLRSKRGR